VHEAFKDLDGILNVKVSLADRTARVEHKSSLDANKLVSVLNEKHLGASLKERAQLSSPDVSTGWQCSAGCLRIVTQLVLFAVGTYCELMGQGRLVSQLLLGSCLVLSYGLFYKAVLAVLRRRANVELMMSLAALGSAMQADLVNAAMVCVLVALLEAVTEATLSFVDKRLRSCITVPVTMVALADGRMIEASDLKKGMTYLVRVGDAIPTDGSVVKGQALVDESRLTGEAVPVSKDVGSKVRSGAVLQAGFLEVVADGAVEASFQNRIQDAVREAKNTESHTQEVVAKFAVWYTPAIILVAVAVAVAQKNLTQFLVIIVAGCPCAILGAAPFAHAAAIAVLAKRHNLLVKETSALESLARLNWLGIDKTGTITTGQFAMMNMKCVVSEFKDSDVLKWAASVESKDNHPIARSVVQSFTGCMATFVATQGLPQVTNFTRQGRCGVMGSVDGHWIRVGNADFLSTEDITLDGEALTLHSDWSKMGTVLFVTVDEKIAAVILMVDSLRTDAQATISMLRELGVEPVMLSGDKGPAAHAVAAKVGIDTVHFGLLPEEKSALIMEASWAGAEVRPLNQRGPRDVGFVGDGLNDCIALANAHVGIVMQEVGTQATVDAASAVLQGSLGQIPAAIIVARRTQRLVTANIALALAINVTVIVAAALVGVPLWLGILADSGGLLAVLLNSLWPLCWKVEPAKGSGPKKFKLETNP